MWDESESKKGKTKEDGLTSNRKPSREQIGECLRLQHCWYDKVAQQTHGIEKEKPRSFQLECIIVSDENTSSKRATLGGRKKSA